MAALPASAHAKYASLIIEEETGRVLHQSNADTLRHPASLTKIMTLYMMFDALKEGRVTMDTRMKVSRRAEGMAPSKLGLRRGQTLSVRDAIFSLVTKSANDAAVVVAEHLGKTEIEFARMMTERARAMGMKRTTFRNASGLYNKRQKSTARDMARLAQRVRADFPEYYDMFSARKFKYKGRTYKNHNNLLGRYTGTDGIKTGYIGASGFNLVASVERHGLRVVGVVFGGRSAKSRDRHMIKLLDNAFRGIEMVAIRAPLKPGSGAIVAANSSANIVPSPTKPTASVKPAAPTLPQAVALRAPVPDAYYAEGSRGDVPTRPNRGNPDALTGVSPPSELAKLQMLEKNKLQATGSNKTDLIAAVNAALGREVASTSATSSSPQVSIIDESWMIQVGAFRNELHARTVATQARNKLGSEGTGAIVMVKPRAGRSGPLYRSRLAGFSEPTARDACRLLKKRRFDCVVFAPTDNPQVAER